MAGSEKQLHLFSESTYPSRVSTGIITSSPTIDLTVTVNDDGVLSIWRSKNQLVAKHAQKGQTVGAVRWKADGQYLAVGWSDGTVRLIDLEGSKAVDRIKLSDDGSSHASYIAWARNLTGKRHLEIAKGGGGSRQRVLSDGLGLEHKEDLIDLPHELTFLEVDTALPKLSPLPVSGGTGDDMFVFSTTTSLDAVFRPLRPEDNDVVDVMIVGTEDGDMYIAIYDSFVVGRFQYSPAQVKENLLLRCHSSHPDVSTHSLLMRKRGGDDRDIYLVQADLRFVSYSPVNLSLLASKTTTLHKLLRYIKQTQVHMLSEWKSTRELPSRFLMGVQDDLQNMPGGPTSIVQALFHTVMTGDTFPAVKEWLVDSLAERGHKRWDKAVTTGLENLRALVHENMIPALERCGLILSRLLGIARFHQSGEPIGFNSSEITRLVDIVSTLTFVSRRILIHVMEELDLFWMFSSWLRLEIDQLASSSLSEELTEKEATMDHGKVLTYIQNCLVTNPLTTYFDAVSKDDYTNDWNHVEDAPSLMDMVHKQLNRQQAGQPHMKALPQVDFLVGYLAKRAGDVFKNIAEAQKRNVRFDTKPTRISLGEPGISKYDMRTCAMSKPNGVDAVTFTAVASEEQDSNVYVFRTNITIINGISHVTSTEVCGLSLPAGKLVDFKFLNDDVLFALWYPEEKPPVLLQIPFRSSKLVYAAYDAATPPTATVLSGDEVSQSLSPLTFPDDDGGFWPVQMEVKEANSERGETPARVCLLGNDQVNYRVFSLPEVGSALEHA